MRINDFQLTKYFNLIDFQCPCCHTVLLNPVLVIKLEKLREDWGKELIVNSGYRCSEHNKKVGGVEKSLHKIGQAADVRVPISEQEKFQALAMEHGFTKVIRYGARGFMHLQIGDNSIEY